MIVLTNHEWFDLEQVINNSLSLDEYVSLNNLSLNGFVNLSNSLSPNELTDLRILIALKKLT